MNCNEVRAHILAFLRDELTDEERVQVQDHLVWCNECQTERLAVQDTVRLVVASRLSVPPGHLRSSTLGAVEAERLGSLLRAAVPELPPQSLRAAALEKVQTRSEDRRRAFSIRESLLAAAAIVAVILAAGGWFLYQGERTDVQKQRRQLGPLGHELQVFSLQGSRGDVQGWLTHYRHDNYRVTLDVGTFDVTPAGTYYAVWLKGPKGETPIGTFRLKRSDRFIVSFPAAVDPADYPEILVTLEPDDGDPLLTGEVVASGVLDSARVHHGKFDD